MNRNILITEPLSQNMMSLIHNKAVSLGFNVIFSDPEKSDFLNQLEECEIFFGIYNPNTVIPSNLKWICVPLAGINNYLNKQEFLSGECILSCSSGAYGVTISEHIIMLILMLLRRMPEYSEDLKNHIWRNDRHLSSIYNSNITVLGTGDIGTTFAESVKSFGPKEIIGINKSGTQTNPAYTKIVKIEDIDKVLPYTDILVMALPETQDTINILNKDRIALLTNHCIVINVGRGSSIDEKALTDALINHKIAGAGLDVLKIEPIEENNPLLKLNNVIITPHMAGQRTLNRTVEKMVEMFLNDLEHYTNKEKLEKQVDFSKGY